MSDWELNRRIRASLFAYDMFEQLGVGGCRGHAEVVEKSRFCRKIGSTRPASKISESEASLSDWELNRRMGAPLFAYDMFEQLDHHTCGSRRGKPLTIEAEFFT